MKTYLKRIQKDILPFILIGLLTKIVFHFQGTIFKWSWLKSYLAYADISLNLRLNSFRLFGEYIAPVTIAYSLVFLYVLASFHRLVFGRVGENGSFFVNKVILPLEGFASLLSISTLGLLVGISIASIPHGLKAVLGFFIFSLYPIFFLLILSIGVGFVYVQNKTISTQWVEKHLPAFLRSRIDGIYLLLLFLLAITFHTQIHYHIKYFGKWLLKSL